MSAFEYTNPALLGKMRRIHGIFSDTGKCMIVPLDDSLISYSHNGLVSWKDKIADIQQAVPNGILCYLGTASLIDNYNIPLIYNVTASTINSSHTNTVLVSNVEDALKSNASAVAVHINVSSRFESNMLKAIGKISSECHQYGMPLLVIAYPRKECDRGDDNYENMKKTAPEKYTHLVSHCVRIAFELGADIIKTQYTGSIESFREVIAAAVNKPVLIAGGNIVEEEALYKMVRDAILAGSAGVSIGRNVFHRSNSQEIINKIKSIIFAQTTEGKK